MPGLLVHLPVLVAFLVFGAWACLSETWLVPLIAVYGVVGLYWGRDIAILAHYSAIVTLLVFAAVVFGLPNLVALPRPGAGFAVVLTSAIALVFWLYVRSRVRADTADTPALHFVVRKLDTAAIAQALDAGADVNEKDTAIGWGYTPLHLATALAGQEDLARIVPVVELLVKRGADLNARDGSDKTPLHLAAEKGSEALARKLLDLGADVNAATAAGETPLFLAVRKGSRPAVEALLIGGGDRNVRSRDMTLLTEAARNGHFDLMTWLIESGAPANDDGAVGMLVTYADPRAMALLQKALDAGAKPRDEMLRWAASAQAVRLLGQHGVRADSLAADKNPAFSDAAPSERLPRLEALRELGCNVAAADSSGRTLLHRIASSPDELAMLDQTLPKLLGWGIDINARDDEGNTALHGLVRLSGAVNPPDADAVARWARTLIEAGADPAIKNAKGDDCAALAKRLKAPRAVKKALAVR